MNRSTTLARKSPAKFARAITNSIYFETEIASHSIHPPFHTSASTLALPHSLRIVNESY